MKSGIAQVLHNLDQSTVSIGDRIAEIRSLRVAEMASHERKMTYYEAEESRLIELAREHQDLRERTEAVKRIGEAVERGM